MFMQKWTLQMISLAVLSLVRTTIPDGLWFNPYKVAMKVLRFTNSGKKYSYSIDLMCINGIWGGSVHFYYPTGGVACPLGADDCKFLNVDECIAYYAQWINERLIQEVKNFKIVIPKLEDFVVYERDIQLY
jgi:hypothetical protein